jgi:STE24 endopeptidase
VWAFLLAFQLLVTLVAPKWIEPLFIKVKPLEDESLGVDIRAMAARASVRVDRIFQVDASRRSTHTNAYFSGFGPVKRVVLYDTLLDKLDHSEILGVLAHELGHWRLRHILKSLLMLQVVSLAACLAAHWLVEWKGLPGLFGLGSVSLFSRLTLTLYLGTLASTFLTPAFSALSRRNERQADAFACKLADPSALASGLVKLARDNLANLHPHPLYVAVFASHPPTVDRIQRLKSLTYEPEH